MIMIMLERSTKGHITYNTYDVHITDIYKDIKYQYLFIDPHKQSQNLALTHKSTHPLPPSPQPNTSTLPAYF